MVRRLEHLVMKGSVLTGTEAFAAAMNITGLSPMQAGGFLEWAIVFFVLAIIAAALGATGVAGVTMSIAKWFVLIFLVLMVVSLLL